MYVMWCASESERQKEMNGLDFRLIELKIEKMEEEIENLNSTVEEHNGIIGKDYLFFRQYHIFGQQQSVKKTEM